MSTSPPKTLSARVTLIVALATLVIGALLGSLMGNVFGGSNSGGPKLISSGVPAFGSYVRPGTVGYLAAQGKCANGLTEMSATNKVVPNANWSWFSQGLRFDGTAIQTLNCVWVRGPIYWNSTGTLSITNSTIDARNTADGGIWPVGAEKSAVDNHAGGNVTVAVTDSTVLGTTNNSVKGAPVDHFSTYFLTRDDLSGYTQGIDPGDGSVIDSVWIHNIRQTGTAHLDGIFLEGSNITVMRSYIDGSPTNGSSGVTAGIFSQGGGAGSKLYANYINMWGSSPSTAVTNQDSTSMDVMENEFANGSGYSGRLGSPGSLGTHTGNKHTDGSAVGVVNDPSGMTSLGTTNGVAATTVAPTPTAAQTTTVAPTTTVTVAPTTAAPATTVAPPTTAVPDTTPVLEPTTVAPEPTTAAPPPVVTTPTTTSQTIICHYPANTCTVVNG